MKKKMNLFYRLKNYINALYPKPVTREEIELRRKRAVAAISFRYSSMKWKLTPYLNALMAKLATGYVEQECTIRCNWCSKVFIYVTDHGRIHRRTSCPDCKQSLHIPRNKLNKVKGVFDGKWIKKWISGNHNSSLADWPCSLLRKTCSKIKCFGKHARLAYRTDTRTRRFRVPKLRERKWKVN